MHSFSFLPVWLDGSWHLVSELGLAKYLRNGLRNSRLAESLETAKGNGMELVQIDDTELLKVGMEVEDVLSEPRYSRGPCCGWWWRTTDLITSLEFSRPLS